MPAKFYQAKRPVRTLDPAGTANRVTESSDGVTMLLGLVSASMLARGATVRGATRVVAASNASATVKARADYVCDGTADDVEINAALAALGSVGGVVQLSEGQFNLAASVATTASKQSLRGLGIGVTVLRMIDNIVGTNIVGVTLTYDDSDLMDLTIDGNKANNASQTNLRLVHFGTIGGSIPSNRALMQRVHLLNSPGTGFVVSGATAALPTGAVVRDCVAEGCANTGFYLRGATSNPLVASGLTAKGSGVNGIVCDTGPVILSDCQALSGTGSAVGFVVSSAGAVSLANCTAQANAGHGFVLSGTRPLLTGCQAISNTGSGFYATGSQPLLVGCFATGHNGADPNGAGFRVDTGAVQPLFQGCTSYGDSYGFRHGAGFGLYQGCRALNDGTAGFSTLGGTAHFQGCIAYGVSGGHGFWLNGGTDHTIDGCRPHNSGGYGVVIATSVVNGQVTNNHFQANGQGGDNTYWNLLGEGDQIFYHGNVMRMPAAAPRAYGGIGLSGNANDSYVGLNDLYQSGVTTPLLDNGVQTRRAAKLQLDYTATTDLIAGQISAGVGTNLGVAGTVGVTTVVFPLSFRVDSPTSLVEIDVQGSMMCGNVVAGTTIRTQLVIGGTITKLLGAEIVQTATQYQNAFSGSQPLKLEGLAVGTYTLHVQVQSNGAATCYLRPTTNGAQEYLHVQVTEYAR